MMELLRRKLAGWLGPKDLLREAEANLKDARQLFVETANLFTAAKNKRDEDRRETELAMARQRLANSAALADYENTLHAIQQLTLKFDAYADALGVVVQPGPELGDEPAVIFSRKDGVRVLAERRLAAAAELREMRVAKAQALAVLRSMRELELEARQRAVRIDKR
jgi:hypothetical protein